MFVLPIPKIGTQRHCFAPHPNPAFSPQTGVELKYFVDACLELSPKGDCPNDPHGAIGEWEVSSITGMDKIFFGAEFFNGDISEWDVSSVTTAAAMFVDAASFNGDLSKWDVSSVTNMAAMFGGATVFNSDLSKWDVSHVTDMFGIFGGRC